MNKKKILFISGIVLLILLSFMCGNTFAKYLTTYKTSADLQIAKWKVTQDFLINGKSSKTENFDLITTYDPTTLVNGKIAPGTSGTFGVILRILESVLSALMSYLLISSVTFFLCFNYSIIFIFVNIFCVNILIF